MFQSDLDFPNPIFGIFLNLIYHRSPQTRFGTQRSYCILQLGVPVSCQRYGIIAEEFSYYIAMDKFNLQLEVIILFAMYQYEYDMM